MVFDVPVLPAGDCAWFLDIDGTLVEIADAPDRVLADASLLQLVGRLAGASRGALALISGRSIEEIDRLFAPLHLPAAGQHGVEHRSASGRLYRHEASSSGISSMLRAASAWTAGRTGIVLEDKGYTFAMHYRQAPQMGDEVRVFLQRLLDQSAGDYRLQGGKMVFEIRPGGKDKGTAVVEFMQEPPFRGRTPVFIGDDIGDEYAFSVVDGLGGMAIKVGTGESVARWRLPSVAAVRAWIRECLPVECGLGTKAWSG